MALQIALAQFNSRLGDFSANTEAILKLYNQAADVDLVVFPEMAVCGYPPGALALKTDFTTAARLAVEKLAAQCTDKVLIAGFVDAVDDKRYNCLAVLKNGVTEQIYRKCILPDCGLFDEQRYFEPGTKPAVIEIKGLKIALTICQDIRQQDRLAELLKPVGQPDVLLNISALPFYIGSFERRRQIISNCAASLGCAVTSCNLVGGQDELVFDGRSMFADSTGRITAQAKAFDEDLLIAEIKRQDEGTVSARLIKSAKQEQIAPIAEIYKALVLGARDYVGKNGFSKVVIGLSGGIDSAVTTALTVAAVANKNVIGITMPSKFNRPETISDASKTAKNLGITFLTMPIEQILAGFDRTLADAVDWDEQSIAYENLQARIRGNILMSLSNRFGWMVFAAGNKSEAAVGYATLYGDTAGGFAPIKDIPKTMVYELADYINNISDQPVIPAGVIERHPSAELRPNQKDSDTLPDYTLLDKILKGYLEENKSLQQLTDAGLANNTVKQVIRMVNRSEYKRRQSPPGVRITPKTFGPDGRMPITNCYLR